MDKADAINLAEKYAVAVKANFDYSRMILFGSYAKGNQNEDSDIDIAIILKDFTNVVDMQFQLMKLRRNIDSRIEPHPFRECDFILSSPMVNEILKYGSEIKID